MTSVGNGLQPDSAETREENERIHRELREQITIVKVRAQLLRRQLDRGTLQITDLDRALVQIDRATERLNARIRELERND
jgi:hypothetical protein